MTLEEEKDFLKSAIAFLEEEFYNRSNSLTVRETFDYQERMNNLKDCYTKALEELQQERRG